MKTQFLFLILGLSCTLAHAVGTPTNKAEAVLINSSGEKVGSASISESKDGLKVTLQASHLPPGVHGIHFHETGKCDGPDFKTAGSHFNPSGKEHGLDNKKGPHEGDLPNLEVKNDGTAKTTFSTHGVTLKSGDKSLLKPGATALVIHAKPDDQVTNPSGSSGDRIACGIITSKSSD